LTALAEFQRQTAARFQSGEVARSDVALSDARLAGAEADLARAEADRSAAQFAFERVVGVKPGALSPTHQSPTTPATLEDALTMARASSPFLALRREAEDAAKASIGAARAQRFPTISVGVEASSIRDEFLLGYEADSVAVVARARMPLFTGGRIGAEVREAKAKAHEASAVRRSAELAIDEAVARSFTRYHAALDQQTAAERQAAASRIALDDIRLEVKAGARPILDGLDAERDHLAARLQFDQAKADVVTTAYDLIAAIGVTPAN
jgi:outer membrane protein